MEIDGQANLTTLDQIPLGGRLVVRSRKDWRMAVVCRIGEEVVTLSIASPRGRNYRLRRDRSAAVALDGGVPVLRVEYAEDWRENFSSYDMRW